MAQVRTVLLWSVQNIPSSSSICTGFTLAPFSPSQLPRRAPARSFLSFFSLVPSLLPLDPLRISSEITFFGGESLSQRVSHQYIALIPS